MISITFYGIKARDTSSSPLIHRLVELGMSSSAKYTCEGYYSSRLGHIVLDSVTLHRTNKSEVDPKC